MPHHQKPGSPCREEGAPLNCQPISPRLCAPRAHLHSPAESPSANTRRRCSTSAPGAAASSYFLSSASARSCCSVASSYFLSSASARSCCSVASFDVISEDEREHRHTGPIDQGIARKQAMRCNGMPCLSLFIEFQNSSFEEWLPCPDGRSRSLTD